MLCAKEKIDLITLEGFQKALLYMDMFLEGMACTVTLSALTVIFGFVLALLLALMRMSKVAPLRWAATVYVEVFRATPMLVQVFIVYYILLAGLDLPTFKLFGLIRFERFVPGVIALSLNSAAGTASSASLRKASLPFFCMNSSGSLPSVTVRTLGLPPAPDITDIPLSAALMPALSESYESTIFFEYLQRSLAWLSVRAVPREAATFLTPL